MYRMNWAVGPSAFLVLAGAALASPAVGGATLCGPGTVYDPASDMCVIAPAGPPGAPAQPAPPAQPVQWDAPPPAPLPPISICPPIPFVAVCFPVS